MSALSFTKCGHMNDMSWRLQAKVVEQWACDDAGKATKNYYINFTKQLPFRNLERFPYWGQTWARRPQRARANGQHANGPSTGPTPVSCSSDFQLVCFCFIVYTYRRVKFLARRNKKHLRAKYEQHLIRAHGAHAQTPSTRTLVSSARTSLYNAFLAQTWSVRHGGERVTITQAVFK